jgi:hypothetical protein
MLRIHPSWHAGDVNFAMGELQMNLMAQVAACFAPLEQLGGYQCRVDPTWQKSVQSLSDFPPALWILLQALDVHPQLRTRTFNNCFDVDTGTQEWSPQ